MNILTKRCKLLFIWKLNLFFCLFYLQFSLKTEKNTSRSLSAATSRKTTQRRISIEEIVALLRTNKRWTTSTATKWTTSPTEKTNTQKACGDNKTSNCSWIRCITRWRLHRFRCADWTKWCICMACKLSAWVINGRQLNNLLQFSENFLNKFRFYLLYIFAFATLYRKSI